MFLTSLVLMSCQSEPQSSETQADMLAKLELIGQRSIQQLLQVDPTLIHEAWTESMLKYADDSCPPMEEHNGMDLWRESCTTSTGNQFLGWALNLRIDHHIENGYGWEIHDWLSGQARIIAEDVELANYGDILHESGTNPFGRRALHGLIFGNFAWNDDSAAKTWLADNLNIEYEYRFEETESGGWSSHADAWISNFDDSIHGEAAIWEDISFNQDTCDLEPVDGILWLREGDGRWVTVEFDDTCDGCGNIIGTERALCFDFSMWFDWEEYPWEPRSTLDWGGRVNRRSLIKTGLASAGLLSLPTMKAQAYSAGSDRKFLFIRVPNGWDTTRVFTPMFSTSGIVMESDGFTKRIEDIEYVSHGERPAVDTFFETYGQHTALLNGLIVPSVNHAICDRLLYSDSSTGSSPDWATQIASAQSERYTLPHVLISGRVLAGNRANLIVNVGTEGQMNQLLSGDLMSLADHHTSSPRIETQDIVSKHLAQSASALGNPFGDFYEQSMERIRFMKDISDSGLVNWNTDGSLTSQIHLTRDLFKNDLTRCVTLEFKRESFDSHVDNSSKQSANFQDLFVFLNEVMTVLQQTFSSTGGTLLDDVCVVVLSEMGRTPYENGGKGKDHWQHTSAMLMGSGIQGGRTYGQFSSLFYGQPLDLQSGDVTATGQDISTRLLGDTLLALGDVGNEFTPLGEPIWAMMR